MHILFYSFSGLKLLTSILPLQCFFNVIFFLHPVFMCENFSSQFSCKCFLRYWFFKFIFHFRIFHSISMASYESLSTLSITSKKSFLNFFTLSLHFSDCHIFIIFFPSVFKCSNSLSFFAYKQFDITYYFLIKYPYFENNFKNFVSQPTYEWNTNIYTLYRRLWEKWPLFKI